MIADQTVAPEAQDPVSFIRRIEHHKREIARQRDACGRSWMAAKP